MNTTYTEWNGTRVNMKPEEITWFENICSKVFKALPEFQHIPIDLEDLEMYPGRSKNALGICCCTDDDIYSIHIDSYTVHDLYQDAFEGIPSITRMVDDTSLEEIICHELAHTLQWRHCKRHTRLTQELLQRVHSC